MNSDDIVVDVSVVMAVLLNEPQRSAIELATIGHDLIAPGCIGWELGNVLYGALKRDRIKLRDALSALAEYERIPIRQIAIDLASAVRIASKYRIPTYDACYLECARAQRTRLMTLDERMARIAAVMKIDTVEVLE